MIGLSRLHEASVCETCAGTGSQLLQQDILWFQIAMNEPRLVQETKGVQKLLSKHPDKSRAQPSELVLLDELVQIHTEQLEDETKMLLVNEGVFQPQDVVIVVLVELAVEL
jgi:hypothetical protein